ncbi:MAG TPA: hypothetical protein DEV81_02360 [Cyanobacteria bacterium UBA11049]|nr:hypothetical protein [Cyanobacteria bacterium UBA11049]
MSNPQLATKFDNLSGWRLVFGIVGATALLVASIVAIYGTGEPGIRLWLKVTGRTDTIPFAAAFIASPLHQILPSTFSAWLVKNRRFLGISFALQHLLLHLPAVIWFLAIATLPLAQIAIAGFAYVLIAAMLVTSFETPARWLGQQRWKILHKIGLFYVMFVFIATFLPKAVNAPITYAPFVTLLLGAVILRIVAFMRRQRLRRSASA